MTIECKYSCGDCGIYRQSVNVPIRTTESVTDWMDRKAIPHLVADHELRSPHCHPKEFSEVMIPVPAGTEKIGGPVRQ